MGASHQGVGAESGIRGRRVAAGGCGIWVGCVQRTPGQSGSAQDRAASETRPRGGRRRGCGCSAGAAIDDAVRRPQIQEDDPRAQGHISTDAARPGSLQPCTHFCPSLGPGGLVVTALIDLTNQLPSCAHARRSPASSTIPPGCETIRSTCTPSRHSSTCPLTFRAS
jgi:hypothetical protein